MATQKAQFYRATIINPKNDTECDYFADGLLVVQDKKIKDLLDFEQGQHKYARELSRGKVLHFKKTIMIPAFFDMHFHWVQDDVREMPKDSLLEWLNKYTFPAEMKFENKQYSNKKAKSFFKKLSKMGTLGGACFSSIHQHALDAAMKEVKGDFVIGNVLMNMHSPKELTQTEEESLKITKYGIKKYGKRFCFTPRFAISTNPRVMKEGSGLADKAKCFKQSHLSETPKEIEFVLSIYKKISGFQKIKNYTEIYHKSGMLGPKSLMGHGIYLSAKELKLLARTKTSLIHCPTSNAPIKNKGLGSGLFDFRKVEKAGVRWALGSDIGGGPYLSMLDVMKSFVEQNQKVDRKKATAIKALNRATLAGAQIMGLDRKTGNLNPGKEANFILVNMPTSKNNNSAEELLRDLFKGQRELLIKKVGRVYFQGTRLN